jgi:hypothetical protein
MGTKYSSQSASGYNSSPPPDDGTHVASNQITWAGIKAKLADVLKTLADAINTQLVTFTDFSGSSIVGAYTTQASDHMQTLEASGTFTVKLMDATTAAAGYIVSINNVGSGVITVTPLTGTDTLDGTAGGSITIPQYGNRTFKTNVGANGYYSQDGLKAIATAAGGTNDTTPANTAFVITNQAYCGQCQLAFVSTTQIKLSPYKGNKLAINGTNYAVPSAGVTLANTGLSAATKYYIYAYMNSGTMTLEASTTTHATDTNTGMQIKSGDATRSLVGMVYMNSGTPGVFAWGANKRWVRSWFNDPGFVGEGQFTADRSTGSTSLTEVSSEIRVQFLVWTGEIVTAYAQGSVSNSTLGDGATTGIGYNTTSAAEDGTVSFTNPSGGSALGLVPFHVTAPGAAPQNNLVEGNNYVTLLGAAALGGTAVYAGTSSPICELLLVVPSRA